MFGIFDSSCNSKNFEALQKIKKSFEDVQIEEQNKRKEQMEREYREKHIFSSYEEALDWLISNPDSSIDWHCKILKWEEDKKLFRSFEQEYDLSGVVPYNIVRHYTKKELLNDITLHQIQMKEKYPDYNNGLDKYGKLEYVSIK